MGEIECENAQEEIPKKSRHRKKHLYNAILQQMEFYFSDSNLSKDRFLSQALSENSFIDLDVFLKFNKIRKLNCNIDDIRKAVRKSDIIQLSEDNEKVGRKTPIKVKANVDECTIYVENIKSDANHDWLRQVFSEFGQIVYVSVPKYKQNNVSKGFAFIEYNSEQEASQALMFFESIGCKIPMDKDPGHLQSIKTFEGNLDDNVNEQVSQQNGNKRKRSTSVDESGEGKRIKTLEDEGTSKNSVEESETVKCEPKKKKNKKDKKKNLIKELGMQILSKKEWKKLRNQYLDLQRKKMKEFKQYLHKQKMVDKNKHSEEHLEISNPQIKNAPDFVSGVIVKLKLSEPCLDLKKFKAEIKAISPDIKYVEIPVAGGENAFLRFGNAEAAKEFCSKDFGGEKTLLENQEEKDYWMKTENDRKTKLEKQTKKQRGRDKLFKKAEKESSKYIKFEEVD